MPRVTGSIVGLPVATIIVLILALVGAIDLLIDSKLSDDFAVYAGIIGGSTGLVAIGRGIDNSSKV